MNFYQRPNERWTGGSFVNYEINDHLTAYGEVMLAHNTTDAQVAASGDFFTATPIPCTDPLLTAAEAAAVCAAALAQNGTAGGNALRYIGRRNVEGGGRILDVTNNTIRAVAGLKAGVSAAQYGHLIANTAAQYNGFLGGNPHLTPEKSDTYSAGIVIAPHFIENFSTPAAGRHRVVDFQFRRHTANQLGHSASDRRTRV